MKVSLSEEKIQEFMTRSRLEVEKKSALLELVLNEPGISQRRVAGELELPLGSVTMAYKYLGLTGAVLNSVRSEAGQRVGGAGAAAGDEQWVETIRTLAGFGKSAREIGEKIGMKDHRVRRIMKRNGIVKVKVQKHGRATDYNQGCRCGLCVEAHRKRMAQVREDRKGRPEAVPHGTESGYVNWGCRCTPCRVIGLAKLKERTTVPPEGMVRLGALWNGSEVAAISGYGVTAREHAVALGRSYGGVTGARKTRGIRRRSLV